MSKRSALHILMGCLLAATFAGTTIAADPFPARLVTLVTPYPPGGLADATARQLSMRLSTLWKQSVIVDTRPGANGNVAASIVAKSAADGHTLLYAIPEGLAITKASGANVGFDPAVDLVPVALVAESSTVLIVGADSQFKTFKELMDYAAANPGKLTFGSQGQGSQFHLALERLKILSNTDIVHVPYKGAAPALTDLLGGRINMMIATTTLAAPNVKAGKVRVLAITSGARLSQFPAVPTVAESGFAGFSYPVGLGVFVSKGTPKAIVDQLNSDVRKVMHEPGLLDILAQSATSTTELTPAEFQARWSREAQELGQIITKANIRFE